jgi:hypothetical protein
VLGGRVRVVLGSRAQAQAACFDLVRQKDLTEITVADQER